MKSLSDFADFPAPLRKLVNNTVPAMAWVRKISDGDTIVVRMDRRFYDTSVLRLRLKDINAPELDTPEGKESQAVLAKLLKVGAPVVVTTFKQTHDRYEAVVKFLHRGKILDLAEELLKLGAVTPAE